MRPDERRFEDAIEASLLDEGGYLKSVPSNFDPDLGLDTGELFAFIGATQMTEWERLLGLYGNDPDEVQRGFARRLASELDSGGTVESCAMGVVDLSVTIRLAFFKPAHNLTPDLLALYQANRVTVTRQLAFEPGSNKTLDMVLLVNGIPTATAELKTHSPIRALRRRSSSTGLTGIRGTSPSVVGHWSTLPWTRSEWL
jgi:type I restriction enzyme R subunit